MNEVKPVALTAEEVLGPEILAALDSGTVRLFMLVWQQMRSRNLGQVVMTAPDVTRRASLTPSTLPAAMRQLVSERLMDVTERHGVIVFRMIDEASDTQS